MHLGSRSTAYNFIYFLQQVLSRFSRCENFSSHGLFRCFCVFIGTKQNGAETWGYQRLSKQAAAEVSMLPSSQRARSRTY